MKTLSDEQRHKIKELALDFYHQGFNFSEMMNFTCTSEGIKIIKEMEVEKYE